MSRRKYQRLLLILSGKLVFVCLNTALHLLDALCCITEVACLSRKSSRLETQPSFIPEGIELYQCVRTLIVLVRILHYYLPTPYSMLSSTV